jgi:hypothetical protein
MTAYLITLAMIGIIVGSHRNDLKLLTFEYTV